MRAFAAPALHLLLFSALATSAPVLAHDFAAGPLKIGHPWTRATPPGAGVAGGYLSIENTGTTPDRLIGAVISIAGRTEIHEMAMRDGIMRMRELSQGIEIRPGEKVELKPGSFHLMWIDLTQPLATGIIVTGALRFEKAGLLPVDFVVEAIGTPSSGHQGR